MPMSSDLALRVSGICKGFDLPCTPLDRVARGFTFGILGRTQRHEVLKDVSFDVRRGETIALLGVNGAGKSTLLQMIAGTMSPTGGSIEVRGRIAALLELGAGFSPDFTGRENAILNARLLGVEESHARSLMPWILEFSGIGEAIDRPVRFYSSGMFVRLAFAVAAAVRPDIMIIDEALGVGDAAFQAKCYRYLKHDLSEVTKILVSHDGALVGALADRAIVLREGRVAYDGGIALGLDAYEGAVNGSLARKGADSAGDGHDLSLAIREVRVGGRAKRQCLPGDAVVLDMDVLSRLPGPVQAFLSMRVLDAYGQYVVSNEHHVRGRTLVTVRPGQGSLRMEMTWPGLRRGEYVVGVRLESSEHGDLPIQSSPASMTLDCIAPAGAPAIVTIPAQVGEINVIREMTA